MKKSIKFLTSILSAILGLFSGLVSCNTQEDLYMGAPPSVGGKVFDKVTGQGIKELRVELLKNSALINTTSTDTNGDFQIYFNQENDQSNLTLRIYDIDGAANGEYKGVTNTIYVNNTFRTNVGLDKN